MNVDNLVEQGAKIRIIFHQCKNLNEAYNKIKPFKHLGKIVIDNHNGTYWLKIYAKGIEITAFYKNKQKNNPLR